MAKFDFTKLETTDISGNPLKDLDKVLANAIYAQAKDLSLVDVALKMFRGEEVELSKSQVDEIKEISNSERAGFHAFFRKAIQDFLAE